MSEAAPQFNPVAEARARANTADVGRQVFNQFMERDAVSADAAEHAQGYNDFADFLEARPKLDKNGKLVDAKGKRASEDKAYGRNSSEVDAYNSMSIGELAKLSAQAEVNGDRTTMLSVDDELQARIFDLDLGDEVRKDTEPTVIKGREKTYKSEREQFMDRVLSVREKHLKALKEASEKDANVRAAQEQVAAAQNGSSELPAPTGEAASMNNTPFVAPNSEAASKNNTPFVAPTGEAVDMPAPNSSTEAIQLLDAVSNNVKSKEAKDRVVRSFTDRDGRPVVALDGSRDAEGNYREGLNDIMARKVAEGDSSDWNNLVQTMRDVVKLDAKKRGVDVADRLKAFERKAAKNFKELKRNTPVVEAEAAPVKRKLRHRAKAAVGAMVSNVVNGRERRAGHEKMSRRKKIGIAIGAAAVVGAYELIKYKATGNLNPVAFGRNAERAGKAAGATLDRPGGSGSGNVTDLGDKLNNGFTPRSVDMGDKLNNGFVPGARSGRVPNIVDGTPTPGGAGSSEGLTPIVDKLKGATSTRVGNTVTFEVTGEWKPGNTGPKAWANSLGIPASRQNAFLTEVMGSDYSAASRALKVGDKVVANAAQIAKYTDSLPVTA